MNKKGTIKTVVGIAILLVFLVVVERLESKIIIAFFNPFVTVNYKTPQAHFSPATLKNLKCS